MNRPYAAKLHELLQASYNLPNAVVDLGRIELGPSEIKDVTHEIYEREHRSGIDAKAHYLLAASGFNAEQVLSDIAQIKSTKRDISDAAARNASSVAHRQSRPNHGGSAHTGLEIRSEGRRNSRGVSAHSGISSRSHSRDNSSQSFDAAKPADPDFEEFINGQLKVDWNTRKREIYESLGSESEKSNKSSPTSSWRSSERPGKQILGSLSQSESQKFTPLMRSYADIVSSLCDAQSIMPDIVSRFSAAYSKDSMADGVNRTASNVADGASDVSQESGYLQDSWRASEVNDPQKFLELQYRDYIDTQIRTHRQEAKLGGVPSSYNKIKAFVALKYLRSSGSTATRSVQGTADANSGSSSNFSAGDIWDSRLTLVNKTPIWAYSYYLVRAGYLEEAQQVVLERKDIFETIGSSFALYFKAWVESPTHDSSPHYTEMIHSEYHQSLRTALHTDPYKVALYKVIGRCDSSKRTLPQVAVTTEDWLWSQLMLSRENSQYTFADVQKYVQGIGPEHLAQDVPAKYFTILVVLQLYESAVRYLSKYDEIHAVHFAIALLIRQISSATGPDVKAQLQDEDGFSKLLGNYTRFFRNTMPSQAVDYLVSIAGAAGQYEKSYEALQELVLETGRYSLLSGDIQTFTDKPVPGVIENRQSLLGLDDRSAYLRNIAQGAADKAHDDGRVIDAILLYRSAGDSDRVLQSVNTQLGSLSSGIQLGQQVSAALSPSFDILQLARNVMRIDGDSLAKTPGSRDTCLILLAIADCLDLLAQQEWQQCSERLSQTGLLVLSPEPAVTQVRELAQQFLSYDESIARNIPNVSSMALTCIIKITESLKQQGQSVATRLIDQYRGRANNCMVYAGLIQFRMPREVYADSTRMEAELIS